MQDKTSHLRLTAGSWCLEIDLSLRNIPYLLGFFGSYSPQLKYVGCDRILDFSHLRVTMSYYEYNNYKITR